MKNIAKTSQKGYKSGNSFRFMEIDEKDKKIIDVLKKRAELTTSQISKQTRIPITTIHNRIKKMKEEGIIKNYTININFEKIGKPLKAFILITASQGSLTQNEIGEKIKSIDCVENVDIVTGTTDIVAEVRVSDMHILNELITNRIRKIEGVDKTQTLMVLQAVD
jgi:DNA-binding Lrp family transcriptional regulator